MIKKNTTNKNDDEDERKGEAQKIKNNSLSY